MTAGLKLAGRAGLSVKTVLAVDIDSKATSAYSQVYPEVEVLKASVVWYLMVQCLNACVS